MKRPSFQFYPGDWMRSTDLRSCSVGARGLWMDMLCLMHEGTPYGHLKVNSVVIQPVNLARMVGASVEEVEGWLLELETSGVSSKGANGIYSRRMVRDQKLRLKRIENGSLGGNPSLTSPKQSVNNEVNHKDNTNHKQMVADADADADISKEGVQGEEPKRVPRGLTIPPEKQWVIDYGRRIQLPQADCEEFFDYYEAREWVSKDSKIKNWEAQIRLWAGKRRQGAFTSQANGAAVNSLPKTNAFGGPLQ